MTDRDCLRAHAPSRSDLAILPPIFHVKNDSRKPGSKTYNPARFRRFRIVSSLRSSQRRPPAMSRRLREFVLADQVGSYPAAWKEFWQLSQLTSARITDTPISTIPPVAVFAAMQRHPARVAVPRIARRWRFDRRALRLARTCSNERRGGVEEMPCAIFSEISAIRASRRFA